MKVFFSIFVIYFPTASNIKEPCNWRGEDLVPEQRAGEGQDPLHGQGVRGGARA